MAAVKWIFVVLFGLGSAAALGMAFVEGGAPRTVSPRTSPAISLRQFPVMVASVGTPKAPDAAKEPEPAAKPPEPEAAKDAKPAEAEPAKAEPAKAEPVAAAPEPKAEPAKPPPPVAKPPAPVAKAPEPAKPPEPKPEPAAKPEPVAAKAPPAEGVLNLRASDTADVYLDGKKLGGSPLLGVKAKVGNHKVRFDCYDAAGNTVAGPVQVIAVKAEGEVDVEYPCPVE